MCSKEWQMYIFSLSLFTSSAFSYWISNMHLKCVIFKTKLIPQCAPPEFSISGNGNFILPVTQSKGCGVIIDSFSSHSTFNYQKILLPLPKRHGLLQSHSEWNPKFILSPKRPSWTGPLTSLALFPTSLPIPFFVWATGLLAVLQTCHVLTSGPQGLFFLLPGDFPIMEST